MNNYRNPNSFYQNQYGSQQNFPNYKPHQLNSPFKSFQPFQTYPNQMNFQKVNPMSKRMSKTPYRSSSQNFPLNFSQNQQNFASSMYLKPQTQFNQQAFNKPFSDFNLQNFNQPNHFNPNLKFHSKNSNNYFDMYNSAPKNFHMNGSKSYKNPIQNTFANNFNSFKSGSHNRAQNNTQALRAYFSKQNSKQNKMNAVKKMKNRSSKSNTRFFNNFVDISKQRPFSGNFTQNNKSVESTFATSLLGKTDMDTSCSKKKKSKGCVGVNNNDMTQETGYQLQQQQQYLQSVNNQINSITNTQNCLNTVQDCMYDALNTYYSNPPGLPSICFEPCVALCEKKRSSRNKDSSFTDASSSCMDCCPLDIVCAPPCTSFTPYLPCFPSCDSSYNKSNSCNPKSFSDQGRSGFPYIGANNLQRTYYNSTRTKKYDTDSGNESMRNLKKKYKRATQELNRVRKKMVKKMADKTR